MNKLTTRSHREIQDPCVDGEIIEHEDRPIARRQKSSTISVRMVAILILTALLGMSVLQLVGAEIGWLVGQLSILFIGLSVTYIMYRAFHNQMGAFASGAAFMLFMKVVGASDLLVHNIWQLSIALQHVSGVASAVILALLIGILIRR